MFMFMFTQVRPSSLKFAQVRPSSPKFAHVRPSSLKFRDERSFNYFIFFELIEISGKSFYLIKVTVLLPGWERSNLPSEVQGLLRKSPGFITEKSRVYYGKVQGLLRKSPGFITEESINIPPGSDKHPPFFRKTLEFNGKGRLNYDFNVTVKKIKLKII